MTQNMTKPPTYQSPSPATAKQWLDWWDSAAGQSARETWYGNDPGLVKERKLVWEEFLKCLNQDSASSETWSLVRAPGRVNLMGVHIDHRGGTVNYFAFGREALMAFRPRRDGLICGRNMDNSFEPFQFRISDLIPNPGAQPWLNFLEKSSVTPGLWSNYIAAAAVRLQDRFPDKAFGGMDIYAGGDIPPGAGVSSSSALVIASLLAIRDIEELPVEDAELVELAGEGEWFVGTRGGMGDHAAILLSKQGSVISTGFMPLQWTYRKVPENVRVILAHSGLTAQKAKEVKAVYNQRVAAFELGMVWLRESHPELRDKLIRVRDIQPDTLGLSLADCYRLQAELPVAASPEQIESHVTELKDELRRAWDFFGRTHDSYPLREVVLFGAAECARGRKFGELLDRNELDEAGCLMAASHDGDRIACSVIDPESCDTNESYSDFRSPHTDDDFARLISLADAQAPESALELQPGGYRCSLPEIDRMVDLLTPLEGVYGAGLTGAGLGGCIVALCEKETVDLVLKTLRERYYHPGGRDEKVFVCSCIEGSCIV